MPTVLRAGFPQCTYSFNTSLLSIFHVRVVGILWERCLCSHGAYWSTKMAKRWADGRTGSPAVTWWGQHRLTACVESGVVRRALGAASHPSLTGAPRNECSCCFLFCSCVRWALEGSDHRCKVMANRRWAWDWTCVVCLQPELPPRDCVGSRGGWRSLRRCGSQSKSSKIVSAASRGSRAKLTQGSQGGASGARGAGMSSSYVLPQLTWVWGALVPEFRLNFHGADMAGPAWSRPCWLPGNAPSSLYLQPPGPKTTLSLAVFLSLDFCFHFLLTRADRHEDGTTTHFHNRLTST